MWADIVEYGQDRMAEALMTGGGPLSIGRGVDTVHDSESLT